ncbi:MAG: right-handed parallel beta-helix repeat-containing protein [Methanobrevibacter sp.]|nr:right-handed parallel beta-helix repeat-containing protein [Methanobrevibacter sp.]
MILISLLMIIVSINVVSAEDNLTDVSNVVLNTSDADLLGDNLEYNASLKSADNNPLINQTIIFSVNGINYTRLTDLNGFAFLNINLEDGIYPISTAYVDSNNQKLINNNTIYVSHNEGTLIKDNLSGNDIQKIIDDANSGDTLIFAGSTYNDVAVNVEKSLNIISIVKSVFNGNSKSPVITVKSDDVKISNLVISGGSDGIAIENSNNVEVSFNDIVNNYNGIYLKNSNNANISANNLLNNYNGIYLDENVLDTQIISNYISKSENDAISFAKSGLHSNVLGNTLERNENGIFIDMAGDDDLNIEYNTIQRNNGNGIYFGENYRKSYDSGVLNIGNNSIVYNKDFNVLARDSIYMNIELNTNWIASDNPRFNGVCEKVKFKKYHMNVNQLDSNTLSVSVDGIKTDSLLRYSTNGGRNWQYATLTDGKATINVANADGNLVFDYFESNNNYEYQMKDYVPPAPVTPDVPVVPDVPTKDDDSSSSTSNGTNGNSEQIEGNGTSTNQNSGSPQSQNPANVANSNNAVEQASSQSAESSGQSASQAVSSDNAQQSASDSTPKKSVAKSLNIDEEVVRIAGIGFILALILCVIGLYYRDDVKFMLNKRNGQ